MHIFGRCCIHYIGHLLASEAKNGLVKQPEGKSSWISAVSNLDNYVVAAGSSKLGWRMLGSNRVFGENATFCGPFLAFFQAFPLKNNVAR